jgi:hypothetical protein
VTSVLALPFLRLPLDWRPPPEITSVLGVFSGYLLFDAWIGNTDRHHENWAVIVTLSPSEPDKYSAHLAPTYDHASSLGRNEPDNRRRARLETRDEGFSVRTYVERCRSAFYVSETDKQPMGTLEAFQAVASTCPVEARAWLERLKQIESSALAALLARVPEDRISMDARDFANAMLKIAQNKLVAMEATL